jgi:hypothetical protein
MSRLALLVAALLAASCRDDARRDAAEGTRLVLR